MSKLNGRKVSLARVHEATHIANLGNVGPMVSKSVVAFAKDFEMEYQDGGVYIFGTNKEGLKFEAFISGVQCKVIQFDTTPAKK